MEKYVPLESIAKGRPESRESAGQFGKNVSDEFQARMSCSGGGGRYLETPEGFLGMKRTNDIYAHPPLTVCTLVDPSRASSNLGYFSSIASSRFDLLDDSADIPFNVISVPDPEAMWHLKRQLDAPAFQRVLDFYGDLFQSYDTPHPRLGKFLFVLNHPDLAGLTPSQFTKERGLQRNGEDISNLLTGSIRHGDTIQIGPSMVFGYQEPNYGSPITRKAFR